MDLFIILFILFSVCVQTIRQHNAFRISRHCWLVLWGLNIFRFVLIIYCLFSVFIICITDASDIRVLLGNRLKGFNCIENGNEIRCGKKLDESSNCMNLKSNINKTKEEYYNKLLQEAVGVVTENFKEEDINENFYGLSKDSDISFNYKIVGGKAAGIRKYPYMAMYGRICGASILSRTWVITAAHCG